VFGIAEIGLALICMLWIERLSNPASIMSCVYIFYWEQVGNIWGNMYMTMHSVVLTLSCVFIIRQFYLTPVSMNMIIKYEFRANNSNSFYENASRQLILTSALPEEERA
jgi:hypothetical protein